MPTQPTLGSASLPALLHQAGTGLRRAVQRHALELAAGQAADPARHLRGALGQVSVVDRRLARLGAEDRALTGAAAWAEATQAGLARVAGSLQAIRTATIPVAGAEPDAAALARAASAGRTGLAEMTGALNAHAAGRPVFAGNATGDEQVPGAEALLAAARGAAAGAATAAEVIARVQALFDDPAGPVYTGGPPVPLATGGSAGALGALPTAGDPALRSALAEAALAALLDDAAGLPDLALRRDLALQLAGRQPATQAALTGLQAGVGEIEATADHRRLSGAAERDALLLLRDARLGVDPYEAASRLEAARGQIETLYAVTARVARLTLVEALR